MLLELLATRARGEKAAQAAIKAGDKQALRA
jgi:hypothetical protein